MNDYRMPLFARYDFSMVFDQRVGWIRKRLREGWREYLKFNDAEIVSKFCNAEEICPLELIREDKNIKLIGKDHYELEVRFCGDEELWNIYPVEPIYHLDAEFFRLNLILQTFANSHKVAERIFEADLDEIEGIIEQQSKRIDIFKDALPGIVTGEAAKLRYHQPGSRSHLVH